MNRSYLRFSIAFLLFACLCIAGFLAGNRVGFREGYASGQAKRQSEDPFPKVYEIGDLIRSTGNDVEATTDLLHYDLLMGAIQASVFPGEWEALGGPCTLVPVPQLETLVVNATSGVHAGLTNFLEDLSSVKLAVAEAKAEQEDMRRRREEWLQGILQPVCEKLGEELTLIGKDFDLIGAWDIQRSTSDGLSPTSKYVFVDADTVRIPTPDDPTKSMPVWYFASPGAVVVSGKAYTAATMKNDSLVLIPNNEPLSFMVATRADDKP